MQACNRKKRCASELLGMISEKRLLLQYLHFLCTSGGTRFPHRKGLVTPHFPFAICFPDSQPLAKHKQIHNTPLAIMIVDPTMSNKTSTVFLILFLPVISTLVIKPTGFVTCLDHQPLRDAQPLQLLFPKAGGIATVACVIIRATMCNQAGIYFLKIFKVCVRVYVYIYKMNWPFSACQYIVSAAHSHVNHVMIQGKGIDRSE